MLDDIKGALEKRTRPPTPATLGFVGAAGAEIVVVFGTNSSDISQKVRDGGKSG